MDKTQWVIVYYMAYDNNLDPCSKVILGTLEASTQGRNLAVTVLADGRDSNGLKRYSFTGQKTEVETLSSDNSADIQVFSEYMNWVQVRHPAHYYAIVFLDHGGRLDEMCLDENPGEGLPKSWLSAVAVASTLRSFRKTAPGSVELVFLQQCGRASIENLYNFKRTARYVMASQERVGAPNTYYESTLRWLETDEEASGARLALQIMNSDAHYSSYVCVSGKSLTDLPRRLEPALLPLLNLDRHAPELPDDLISCFDCFGESNYDLLEWLEACYNKNSIPLGTLDNLKTWIREELILALAVNNTGTRTDRRSGLSLFVPNSLACWNSYRHYPVYHRTLLRELWDRTYRSS